MKGLTAVTGIRAAIFDLDGTLIDSLSVWADSDREFLNSLGHDYDPKHSAAMKSMHFDSACEYLVKTFSLPFSPKETGERVLKIVENRYLHELKLRDGAEEFLKSARTDGIKMCVATSNKKDLAERTLKNLGVLDFFEFVLTSDEVGCGKESPEIFLKAAQALGTSPGETVVFEDSLHAVKSAKSAGFKTIGMYDPLYDEEFTEIEKLADRVIKSFRELL